MEWGKLANRSLIAENRRGGSAGNKLKMTLGLPVYVFLVKVNVNTIANGVIVVLS